MKLSGHIAVSPILFLLYPFVGLNNVLIAMVSSVLIDIDHIHLIIAEKAFTYKKFKELIADVHAKTVNGKPNRAYVDIIYLLHTVEFNLILLLLSLKFHWLLFVVIGFIFHVISDVIHHRRHKLPIIRWLFLSDLVIYHFQKSSN